ncbi:hypothetical protein DDB_G0276055 [Dictyostelium discoideum AX4]|uniref:Uncharacterized protein n=1 Tax=Dictyostelium discoideum TaxID=44689 RepID=Q86I94_DICDI|nr:hypothetical protein DDB_G0276055 [Dictyostelium discoideum AX4]EAL69327.1 hypothetical protein DDB_G0276055 [Dictyostelium discoideum AX4]|eukprot:XP_643332.1 hypothetical protein DDB_G0276055 [Dictyostelium discoideum AX4]
MNQYQSNDRERKDLSMDYIIKKGLCATLMSAVRAVLKVFNFEAVRLFVPTGLIQALLSDHGLFLPTDPIASLENGYDNIIWSNNLMHAQ